MQKSTSAGNHAQPSLFHHFPFDPYLELEMTKSRDCTSKPPLINEQKWINPRPEKTRLASIRQSGAVIVRSLNLDPYLYLTLKAIVVFVP